MSNNNCQFEPSTQTSSATICKWCGQEKWQHNNKTTMSNNKSSVDMLCQKLANKLGLQAITFYIDHQEEIAEAKAMHKQECVNLLNHHNDIFDTSEEHYNKTFGGNNES
jgi:hypothetical protein